MMVWYMGRIKVICGGSRIGVVLGLIVIYASMMVWYMGHCTVMCGGRRIWGSGIS